MTPFRSTHNYRSALADYPGDTLPNTPSVAIVVPVHNEIAYIEQVVADLLAQEYPALTEIWFVDGQSNDGTVAALQRLQALDSRIHIISNPRKLPAAALNLGFARARSDIVMRIDAHARYAPDVVSQSVRALLANDAGGVGPVQSPAAATTLIGRAIVAAHASRLGVGVAAFRRASQGAWVDSVWNGCYWRHVIEQVGPLREDLWRAEDNDFNERVRAIGYGLYLSPAIKVRYYPRQSLRGLWNQYFSNGIGVMLGLVENRRAFGLRHLAPLILVTGLLGPLLIGLMWHPALLIAALCWILYSGLLLIGTLDSLRGERGSHILLLPITLATLHFSYGIGSLWGLAKIGRRMVGRYAGSAVART